MALAPAVPPDDESILPRPSRRRLYWFLGIIAAVFGGAFAIIVYSDAEPPDVEDLRGQKLSGVPDVLYERLNKLGQDTENIVPYSEPDDLPADSPERMPIYNGTTGRYADFRDYLLDGRGWTASRLAEWGPPLKRFAETCENILAPSGSPAGDSPAAGWSSLSESVGTNLNLAIWMYWISGDREKAVQLAFLFDNLGSRMRTTASNLFSYEAGAEISSLARKTIARLALRDPAFANAAWNRFRAFQPDDSPKAVRLIRASFQRFEQMVDDQSNAHGVLKGYPAPLLFEYLAKTRVLFPLVFKPNLSKALYADYVRAQSRLINLGVVEYRSRPDTRLHAWEARDLAHPTNIYGQFLAYHESGAIQTFIVRRQRARTEYSLLQVLLGVRVFYDTEGRLPSSLPDLVPAYLSEVPCDFADNQQVRYSADAYAIWSIGTNRLQITTYDQPVNRWECFYRLDFSAPKKREDVATQPDAKKAPLAAGP